MSTGFWARGFWSAGFWSAGFWGEEVPSVSAGAGGGGYYKAHPWIGRPARRYLEDVEPEIVNLVIEVVAEAIENQVVQNRAVQGPDAEAEKTLRERLASRHQVWRGIYAQLIRLEYERVEQEYEDAQIALMLFEM